VAGVLTDPAYGLVLAVAALVGLAIAMGIWRKGGQ
jgi:hypothetical protein